MLDIYEQIENLIQQYDLARYLADVSSSQITSQIHSNELQSKINELKLSIQANVATERYEKALKAFEYWSFPFFCEYTRKIHIKKQNEIDFDEIDQYADNLHVLF